MYWKKEKWEKIPKEEKSNVSNVGNSLSKIGTKNIQSFMITIQKDSS